MAENMENQNLETNQDVVADEQQPNQTVDNADLTSQDGNGTDNTANPTANLEEWQKDGRYGKMWHKADDLYNSYKSMEKSFNDINPKYKSLLNILKDNGFQAETLADELKKYADYRNPESDINQVYSYIQKWANNDLYSQRLLQFFQQLEAEEMQRLYPNMSAEQIKKQQELEQRLQRFETEELQRKNQTEIANNMSVLSQGLQDCEGLAKEYGFKMTDEVKNYLLTYCRDNDIDPRYIKSVFRDIYGKQLLEARDKKILANYTARKEKIKNAQIISGGAGKNGTFAPTGDPKSKLRATFEKVLGRQ